MSSINSWLATALMMGLAAEANGQDSPFKEKTPRAHRAHAEGSRCGQCCHFGTQSCPCRLAKETSPACSKYSIVY